MTSARLHRFLVRAECLLAVVLVGLLPAWTAQAVRIGGKVVETTPAPPPAPVKSKVTVLGLVAGRAVTDRQVMIDLVLEDPRLYKSAHPPQFTREMLDRGLQRVLTQIMIVEEGKLVGGEPVESRAVDAQMAQLKKDMTLDGWKRFVKDFELTEADVRSRVSDKLAVNRALEGRVRVATSVFDSVGSVGTPGAPGGS